MEFRFDQDKFIVEENDVRLGYIAFSRIKEDTILLTKTFVEEIARGRGLAKILNKVLFEELNKSKLKIIITCSYSKKYFLENKELFNNLTYAENEEYPEACAL